MVFDWSTIQFLYDAFPVLLNHEFMADIKYSFPNGQHLFAHSFILCLRSEEFYEIFKGTYGTPKSIKLDDVTYEHFYIFLKYLYTDNLKLDRINVFDLMKLSIKYKFIGLQQKCTEYLLAEINDETACLFLEMAITENWIDLKYILQQYITQNYLKILKSKSFMTIKENTLKTIMELDSNASNANEFKKFESLVEWTARCCDSKSKSTNIKILRQNLGTKLNLINFNEMTTEEFAKCLQVAPGLLNDNEIGSIFKKIATRVTLLIPLDHHPKVIKNELMDINDETEPSDDFVLRQMQNWEEIPSSKLNETFYFEFSVSQVVSIESVSFLIYGKQHIYFSLVENDETIYAEKSEIIRRRIKMTPIQLEPMKRYRFQYSIICKNVDKIRANKYESNVMEHILSDKQSVELTVYRRCAHIHWFYFNY